MWCTNLLFCIVFSFVFELSLALNCYQCSGSDPKDPFQCNEWLSSDIDIVPQACDNVYGAKYCIKHIGRFEASGIKCYQCSSNKNIDCADGLIHMGGLESQSCDNVYDAHYCIKSTGLDGGIGAKRFCSSLDLGNYCNYVKQPGDILDYRTCVYSCTGDGCNPANYLKPYSVLSIVTALGMFIFILN